MYACFVQKLFKCVPAQRGRSHSSKDYFLIYLNFFFFLRLCRLWLKALFFVKLLWNNCKKHYIILILLKVCDNCDSVFEIKVLFF